MQLIFSDPTDKESEKLIEDIALKHIDKAEKSFVKLSNKSSIEGSKQVNPGDNYIMLYMENTSE